MARSLSQASRLGALVAEASSLIPLHRSVPISPKINLSARRGYAYAAASEHVSVRSGLGKIGCMSGSMEEKGATRDWGPDPVTGYYRPINHTPEIDPVELRRQMLLSHKLKSASR